jgi:ATP/maltotriose-dependent transcriptional regulator MalT
LDASNPVDRLILNYRQLETRLSDRQAGDEADAYSTRTDFELSAEDDNSQLEVEAASETLAQIYVRQGNFSAASQVFARLKEKYPEKAAYYEEQIAKLQG